MTLTTFLTFFKSFERFCWLAGIMFLFGCNYPQQKRKPSKATTTSNMSSKNFDMPDSDKLESEIDSSIAFVKKSKKGTEYAVWAQDYQSSHWGYLRYGDMSNDNLFTSYDDENFIVFSDKEEALRAAIKYTISFKGYKAGIIERNKIVSQRRNNFK